MSPTIPLFHVVGASKEDLSSVSKDKKESHLIPQQLLILIVVRVKTSAIRPKHPDGFALMDSVILIMQCLSVLLDRANVEINKITLLQLQEFPAFLTYLN
jgi:hypothetical protein